MVVVEAHAEAALGQELGDFAVELEQFFLGHAGSLEDEKSAPWLTAPTRLSQVGPESSGPIAGKGAYAPFRLTADSLPERLSRSSS